MTSTNEILFLGAEGGGKTLLIRRLGEVCKGMGSTEQGSVDLAPENTIPTVGVDLVTVTLGKGPEGSDYMLNLREVGSTMASRWDSYYDECNGIVIVIDASDLGSVGSSHALMLEVLAQSHRLKGKLLALAFAKCDLTDPISFSMIENILRLPELCVHYPDLCIFRGSSLDGSLALLLVEWLQANFLPN